VAQLAKMNVLVFVVKNVFIRLHHKQYRRVPFLLRECLKIIHTASVETKGVHGGWEAPGPNYLIQVRPRLCCSLLLLTA